MPSHSWGWTGPDPDFRSWLVSRQDLTRVVLSSARLIVDQAVGRFCLVSAEADDDAVLDQLRWAVVSDDNWGLIATNAVGWGEVVSVC
ncbi:hypothetical protein WQO_33645 [Streptomyces globisporus C-1027]|uniref:Uncharacterized protein n=1 Tax=Streptomyces globisporus C-1027 TaxID=1172567 RepID=A0A0U3KU56_STRGL|nr:hypothetical protein WQO_33645 [Streptomyces globisporus C-1027]OKJ20207.1 hypothetical protein AMK23_33185 [Streptomyces sp. CB02130]PVC62030.1 hypothetical protein DBP15_32130 [Streptomyces sp. CS065A]